MSKENDIQLVGPIPYVIAAIATIIVVFPWIVGIIVIATKIFSTD